MISQGNLMQPPTMKSFQPLPFFFHLFHTPSLRLPLAPSPLIHLRPQVDLEALVNAAMDEMRSWVSQADGE